jgi:hypothetical protein
MNALTKAAIAATILCVPTVASAADTVIDFGGLPGSNGSVFTGPYVEEGYTTSATGGQVFEGQIFGNPTPSLVVGNVFGGGNTGAVQVTSPTIFTLVSFDQSAQNGAAGYSVQGYLGATLLYTLVGSIPGTFQTVAGNGIAVDRLVFNLTSGGTSTNLDNIVLHGAVPEPGTWAMMLVGFGAIGGAMRRRKQPQLSQAA